MENSNYTARIPHYFCMFASQHEGRIHKYIWHRRTRATFWDRVKEACQMQGKEEQTGCTYVS